MENVKRIEEILEYAIRDENKAFVNKLVSKHNPIDIILRDVDEFVYKEISEWGQNRMFDTIFVLLSSQGLLEEIDKNISSIKKAYSDSFTISKSSYSKQYLNKSLDTTHKVLFTIVFYYRG